MHRGEHEGCAAAGIPTERLTRAEALRLEPNLNPDLLLAVRVPDASMDAMRLALHFFATAQHNGARIRPYMEVEDLLVHDGLVTGARVHDRVSNARGLWVLGMLTIGYGFVLLITLALR